MCSSQASWSEFSSVPFQSGFPKSRFGMRPGSQTPKAMSAYLESKCSWLLSQAHPSGAEGTAAENKKVQLGLGMLTGVRTPRKFVNLTRQERLSHFPPSASCYHWLEFYHQGSCSFGLSTFCPWESECKPQSPGNGAAPGPWGNPGQRGLANCVCLEEEGDAAAGKTERSSEKEEAWGHLPIW